MKIQICIIILSSIITSLAFVLYQTNSGKYKIKCKNKNIIEEKCLEKFKKDFPEKDINFLKIEIEKISDMLLDNQESNRYTYKVQNKANNDYRLDKFRKEIADSVDILDYKKGKLKAQVNYIIGKTEYTLVMHMDTVKKGRVFLKKYTSMKRVVN